MFTFFRAILSALLLIAGVAGFGLTRPALADDNVLLTASLSAVAGSQNAKTGAFITFTLSNKTDKDLSILVWNTPFEGFNGDFMTVTRGGKKVAYIGRLVKRAAPTPDDYLTISAGSSETATINLADAYAIDSAGIYRVQFTSGLMDVATRMPSAAEASRRFKAAKPLALSTPEIRLDISQGRAVEMPNLALPTGNRKGITTYNSCTNSQKSLLATALINAKTYSNNARTSLINTPLASRPTARRYKLWFGTYAPTRYSLIIKHYTKLVDAFTNANFSFDCSCTSNFYAYVYPSQPYAVYLCNAFWTAPQLGTDSKPGTLVHEASHFTVVAGTDDYAYGQSAAKLLATSNIAKALMNADTHEYYAENTPNVPQP